MGQLLQGRLLAALIQFVLAAVLWWILLGWIVHIWSIIDAARFHPPIRASSVASTSVRGMGSPHRGNPSLLGLALLRSRWVRSSRNPTYASSALALFLWRTALRLHALSRCRVVLSQPYGSITSGFQVRAGESYLAQGYLRRENQ